VRTGENVFVWFTRFPSQAHLTGHLAWLKQPGHQKRAALAALTATLASTPQQLRLAPTARSLLR